MPGQALPDCADLAHARLVAFLTADGRKFRRFVHGVRVLGWAPRVLLPGERALPRGAGEWQVMALLLDFAIDSPTRLTVPTDPLQSLLQRRR